MEHYIEVPNTFEMLLILLDMVLGGMQNDFTKRIGFYVRK
jgi:hypothetical protein